MKSKAQILRFGLVIASLSIMSLLTTGCGMKGALYLPAPSASSPQPSTPPASR